MPPHFTGCSNPDTQTERFDHDGAYARRYLDELEVPDAARRPGGSSRSYPTPVVDHADERREALQRFDEARRLAAVDKAGQAT